MMGVLRYLAVVAALATQVYPADLDTDTIKAGLTNLVAQCDINHVTPTGSMLPTFDHTYWLITVTQPFCDLRVGDIIIYRSPKPFVLNGISHAYRCHRIVARSSGGTVLLTKGDNNDMWDDCYVTAAMYSCTVVGAVRKDVVTNMLGGSCAATK